MVANITLLSIRSEYLMEYNCGQTNDDCCFYRLIKEVKLKMFRNVENILINNQFQMNQFRQ